MGDNDRHVVANSDGGWDVVKLGGKGPSAHTDTQAAAIDRARAMIRNVGGGEVSTHGRDGKTRKNKT